jgi:LCP family protein required for cell wall assembly
MDGLRKQSDRPTPASVYPPAPLQPVDPAPREYIPLASPNRPRKKHSFGKIIFGILGTLALIAVIAFLFVVFKGIHIGNGIQIENRSSSFLSQIRSIAGSVISDTRTPLRGEQDGRINILLLGRAGAHYAGRELTDTIMIASIDTERRKVALLSLPRDLYAPIPGTDLYTKINSLYQYGLKDQKAGEIIKASVEEITGQKIHYFATLDFDGFEKVVDALHGISVDVVRDFHDERYPGKNYSYETFDIKKGWQTLDGATALKYVRERHNDPEGDFGRAKRQQQVIQAIKDKSFSLGTYLDILAISNLLDALGESVKTNMGLDDMKSLLSLIRTLDTKNISTAVIDAWKPNSLLRISHVQVGPTAAFILVPRTGTWNEIRDVAEHVFDLSAIRERQAHIADEQPTLTILYASSDTAAAKKLSGVIESDLPFSDISLSSLGTLENRPEQSIIVDRSGGKKPFAIDELMKRFSLERKTSLPLGISTPKQADFLIVLGSDMSTTLDFDENATETSQPEDDSFSEPLAPQPKKKR